MKGWIVVAATLACGSAWAEQPHRSVNTARPFETLDRNSDRQISRTEAGYDRILANTFAILDVNGDGFLSREEYAARTKS